jgi:RNA polymerase sigma factor (sigma-70 family)
VEEVMGVPEARDADNTDADETAVETDFDEAFPEMFRAAYRIAYRLLGSPEDAADCAQEACARACADWSKLIRTGNPVPWTVRVSSNLAIDRLRRAKRARTRDITVGVVELQPDPARIDLQRALDGLPRRQRDIVVLRHLADLSEAEVAALVGCSVGTVKSSASRARAALREVLTIGEDT